MRIMGKMSLPFLDEATAGLSAFGLSAFRPGQAEVVSAALSGRNTVVVMPTGAGKSLCYQLPATMVPGITLVVSPLIALMKDQLEQLTARGIPATVINSTVSESERAERIRKMKEGAYKLVYVAPERFRSPSFLDALSQSRVELFAVDEAHCISQWGHDFRPDYAALGQVRKRLRPARTIALTATATPEVRDDIVRTLLMKDPQVFVAGFDRPNLFLQVVPVTGDEDRRQASLTRIRRGGSGIIYCSTRKAAEGLQKWLMQQRCKAVLYHAGMEEDARRRAHDEFMSTPDAVAIATNAFGMGIDKQDLRFVIHAQIPRAVEAYYQEIGRAGRDGRDAEAILLFNHADVFTQQRMIQSSHPAEAVFADLWNVLQEEPNFERGVQALAAQIGSSEFEVSAALRLLEREQLIERAARGEGEYSIALLPKADEAHPTSEDGQAVLSALRRVVPRGAEWTGELKLVAARANLSEARTRHGLTLLERNGALRLRRPFSGRAIRPLVEAAFRDLPFDLSRVRETERRQLLLLRRMTDYAYADRCRRGFILRYFGEEEVAETCGHCDVCTGERLQVPAKASKAKAEPQGPHSELAAGELRRWRRELSRELGLPPYMIFNDKTLFALATSLPTSRDQFLSIKGTGETQWERFGPKVIEICLLARAAGDAPPGLRTRAAG
jgi:ATP-dependent DNA helicase RecQ